MMSKRKKFVLVSLLLTIGLLGVQLVNIDRRYEAIIFFSGASILLSIWALFTDLRGISWIMTMLLPALYPASVALFYFLLPEHVVSRIVLLSLFGVGMYALLLTENIYAVAAIRTIQLLRAANAVGFLMTVATCVFFEGTLFGFKFPFWANGLVTFLITFPLFLQGLWSARLEPTFRKDLLVYSLALSWAGGELAAAASLIPMTPLVAAILIGGYLYVVLGMLQQLLQEKLFVRTVQEYIIIGITIVVSVLFVTYR